LRKNCSATGWRRTERGGALGGTPFLAGEREDWALRFPFGPDPERRGRNLKRKKKVQKMNYEEKKNLRYEAA